MSSVPNERTHPRWNSVWNAGISVGQAFDTGTPSPALIEELRRGRVPKGRALVPGCGRGYDVYALASPDRQVIGIELADGAIEAATNCPTKDSCVDLSNAIFTKGDFFQLDELKKFDFIYDYTFLCALDPSIRNDWARKMGSLLTPGGILMTLIFPIVEEKEGGPPFKVNLKLLEELLLPQGFEKLECRLLPPELCHPGRGDGNSNGPVSGALSGIGRWKKL